ncbi:hypothetical protein M8J77_022080 [Diaphorina citri]|nr:hypothetical protein M8J77_022080 [Diaphorina citri]
MNFSAAFMLSLCGYIIFDTTSASPFTWLGVSDSIYSLLPSFGGGGSLDGRKSVKKDTFDNHIFKFGHFIMTHRPVKEQLSISKGGKKVRHEAKGKDLLMKTKDYEYPANPVLPANFREIFLNRSLTIEKKEINQDKEQIITTHPTTPSVTKKKDLHNDGNDGFEWRYFTRSTPEVPLESSLKNNDWKALAYVSRVNNKVRNFTWRTTSLHPYLSQHDGIQATTRVFAIYLNNSLQPFTRRLTPSTIPTTTRISKNAKELKIWILDKFFPPKNNSFRPFTPHMIPSTTTTRKPKEVKVWILDKFFLPNNNSFRPFNNSLRPRRRRKHSRRKHSRRKHSRRKRPLNSSFQPFNNSLQPFTPHMIPSTTTIPTTTKVLAGHVNNSLPPLNSLPNLTPYMTPSSTTIPTTTTTKVLAGHVNNSLPPLNSLPNLTPYMTPSTTTIPTTTKVLAGHVNNSLPPLNSLPNLTPYMTPSTTTIPTTTKVLAGHVNNSLPPLNSLPNLTPYMTPSTTTIPTTTKVLAGHVNNSLPPLNSLPNLTPYMTPSTTTIPTTTKVMAGHVNNSLPPLNSLPNLTPYMTPSTTTIPTTTKVLAGHVNNSLPPLNSLPNLTPYMTPSTTTIPTTTEVLAGHVNNSLPPLNSLPNLTPYMTPSTTTIPTTTKVLAGHVNNSLPPLNSLPNLTPYMTPSTTTIPTTTEVLAGHVNNSLPPLTPSTTGSTRRKITTVPTKTEVLAGHFNNSLTPLNSLPNLVIRSTTRRKTTTITSEILGGHVNNSLSPLTPNEKKLGRFSRGSIRSAITGGLLQESSPKDEYWKTVAYATLVPLNFSPISMAAEPRSKHQQHICYWLWRKPLPTNHQDHDQAYQHRYFMRSTPEGLSQESSKHDYWENIAYSTRAPLNPPPISMGAEPQPSVQQHHTIEENHSKLTKNSDDSAYQHRYFIRSTPKGLSQESSKDEHWKTMAYATRVPLNASPISMAEPQPTNQQHHNIEENYSKLFAVHPTDGLGSSSPPKSPVLLSSATTKNLDDFAHPSSGFKHSPATEGLLQESPNNEHWKTMAYATGASLNPAPISTGAVNSDDSAYQHRYFMRSTPEGLSQESSKDEHLKTMAYATRVPLNPPPISMAEPQPTNQQNHDIEENHSKLFAIHPTDGLGPSTPHKPPILFSSAKSKKSEDSAYHHRYFMRSTPEGLSQDSSKDEHWKTMAYATRVPSDIPPISMAEPQPTEKQHHDVEENHSELFAVHLSDALRPFAPRKPSGLFSSAPTNNLDDYVHPSSGFMHSPELINQQHHDIEENHSKLFVVHPTEDLGPSTPILFSSATSKKSDDSAYQHRYFMRYTPEGLSQESSKDEHWKTMAYATRVPLNNPPISMAEPQPTNQHNDIEENNSKLFAVHPSDALRSFAPRKPVFLFSFSKTNNLDDYAHPPSGFMHSPGTEGFSQESPKNENLKTMAYATGAPLNLAPISTSAVNSDDSAYQHRYYIRSTPEGLSQEPSKDEHWKTMAYAPRVSINPPPISMAEPQPTEKQHHDIDENHSKLFAVHPSDALRPFAPRKPSGLFSSAPTNNLDDYVHPSSGFMHSPEPINQHHDIEENHSKLFVVHPTEDLRPSTPILFSSATSKKSDDSAYQHRYFMRSTPEGLSQESSKDELLKTMAYATRVPLNPPPISMAEPQPTEKQHHDIEENHSKLFAVHPSDALRPFAPRKPLGLFSSAPTNNLDDYVHPSSGFMHSPELINQQHHDIEENHSKLFVVHPTEDLGPSTPILFSSATSKKSDDSAYQHRYFMRSTPEGLSQESSKDELLKTMAYATRVPLNPPPISMAEPQPTEKQHHDIEENHSKLFAVHPSDALRPFAPRKPSGLFSSAPTNNLDDYVHPSSGFMHSPEPINQQHHNIEENHSKLFAVHPTDGLGPSTPILFSSATSEKSDDSAYQHRYFIRSTPEGLSQEPSKDENWKTMAYAPRVSINPPPISMAEPQPTEKQHHDIDENHSKLFAIHPTDGLGPSTPILFPSATSKKSEDSAYQHRYFIRSTPEGLSQESSKDEHWKTMAYAPLDSINPPPISMAEPQPTEKQHHDIEENHSKLFAVHPSDALRPFAPRKPSGLFSSAPTNNLDDYVHPSSGFMHSPELINQQHHDIEENHSKLFVVHPTEDLGPSTPILFSSATSKKSEDSAYQHRYFIRSTPEGLSQESLKDEHWKTMAYAPRVSINPPPISMAEPQPTEKQHHDIEENHSKLFAVHPSDALRPFAPRKPLGLFSSAPTNNLDDYAHHSIGFMHSPELMNQQHHDIEENHSKLFVVHPTDGLGPSTPVQFSSATSKKSEDSAYQHRYFIRSTPEGLSQESSKDEHWKTMAYAPLDSMNPPPISMAEPQPTEKQHHDIEENHSKLFAVHPSDALRPFAPRKPSGLFSSAPTNNLDDYVHPSSGFIHSPEGFSQESPKNEDLKNIAYATRGHLNPAPISMDAEPQLTNQQHHDNEENHFAVNSDGSDYHNRYFLRSTPEGLSQESPMDGHWKTIAYATPKDEYWNPFAFFTWTPINGTSKAPRIFIVPEYQPQPTDRSEFENLDIKENLSKLFVIHPSDTLYPFTSRKPPIMLTTTKEYTQRKPHLRKTTPKFKGFIDGRKITPGRAIVPLNELLYLDKRFNFVRPTADLQEAAQ